MKVMKNLKKIAIVAMFGMMCIGGYSAYEYMEITDAAKLMMKNVEALTSDETGADGLCQPPYTDWCIKINQNGETIKLPGTFTAR